MDLQGFEQISTNVDVMIYIYNLLSFEDQLKLAQVTADLMKVHQHFIWTVDYSTLQLYDCGLEYIVTNGANAQRKLLTKDAFEEFKTLYADHVNELCIETINNILGWQKRSIVSTERPNYDLKPFQNLQSLKCSSPKIHLILPQVVENLPHLKSLHVTENSHLLWTNDNLTQAIEYFLKMRNLKRLYLNCNGKTVIKFQQFCKLIYDLQLEVLEGWLELEPDHEDDGGSASGSDRTMEHLILKQGVPLQELRILTTFNEHKWLSSYPTFLKVFENLTNLDLINTDNLTQTMLSALNTYCQQLTTLVIKCTTFVHITTFAIPSKVAKLYLLGCRGLTEKNLLQILTETNISEFKSHDTHYMFTKESKHFSISPRIEHLDIDAIDMCKFPLLYERNKNLKYLKWTHGRTCKNRLSITAPLALCYNLETLQMNDDCELALDILLQLKHLRKFITYIDLPNQWSYLIALLKHSSLRELNITLSEFPSDNIPPEGFSTQVTALKVDYKIYSDFSVDFFLDLFRKNRNMKMSFFCWHCPPMDILKTLVMHPSFPRDLKRIVICGFAISCSDLRKNYDAAMRHVRAVHWSDPMYCIIMCRK